MNRQSGFSLVQVIIAVGLAILVLGGGFYLYTTTNRADTSENVEGEESSEEEVTNSDKLAEQLSNINRIRAALSVYEAENRRYPDTLQIFAGPNPQEESLGGVLNNDVFMGGDYEYTSTGDDYELRYYMNMSDENLYVNPDNYVDGWNTATKEYKSREAGYLNRF